MTVKQIFTRFRAYQLGSAGSSFSYYADGTFTLIEARITDLSKNKIIEELKNLNKNNIDCLHITSWDQDHCAISDLQEILTSFKPKKIEYPGYEPTSENGKNCKEEIIKYGIIAPSLTGSNIECNSITPEYIRNLKSATNYGYNNILFWPKQISSSSSNDNSTIKLFRQGCFNVLSMGDVEDVNIASYLRRCRSFKEEIDVLILAHHGADCATNSKKFFEILSPKMVVCSSNYDNQFDHPKQEVRDRLNELQIPIYTTKTGDVIIESVAPHSRSFKVFNLISNSTVLNSVREFKIKKHHWLSMNIDTIRNLYKPKSKYR